MVCTAGNTATSKLQCPQLFSELGLLSVHSFTFSPCIHVDFLQVKNVLIDGLVKLNCL